MSTSNENRYVWVMEWNWPFRNDDEPSTSYDLYSLEPKAGVSEEEIEKFVTDELFPAVADRPTRAGGVVRHYLLKQHGDVRDPLSSIFGIYVQDESIPAKFESFVTSTELHSFDLVGSWGSNNT